MTIIGNYNYVHVFATMQKITGITQCERIAETHSENGPVTTPWFSGWNFESMQTASSSSWRDLSCSLRSSARRTWWGNGYKTLSRERYYWAVHCTSADELRCNTVRPAQVWPCFQGPGADRVETSSYLAESHKILRWPCIYLRHSPEESSVYWFIPYV